MWMHWYSGLKSTCISSLSNASTAAQLSVAQTPPVPPSNLHSTRSLCTISSAPPTLASLTPPSFSLRARHFLILALIWSIANLPTLAPPSRTSNNHDLVDAVTASRMDRRSDGSDDRMCA